MILITKFNFYVTRCEFVRADHPDKEQYRQYEDQWKTYEYQMDNQKAELAKRREAVLAKHAAMVGLYPLTILIGLALFTT